LLRAIWPLVRTACDAVTVLGVAGLAFQLAAERMPVLLPALVEQFLPGVRLEVRAARFDPSGRLALRRVRLRTAAGEPILAAKRVVIGFSPWALRRGHVDLLVLERPLVTPPAGALAGKGRGGAAWSLGRLVTRGGRFRLPARDAFPAASFSFATNLYDLGSDPRLAERSHTIQIKHVRVAAPDGAPLLAMRGARVAASLAGLTDRHRIDDVVLRSPAVTLAGPLPSFSSAGETRGPPWALGRLRVRDGRFTLPASGDLPGVTFRAAADLRDLSGAGDEATRMQSVTARRVAATLPDGTPVFAADAVTARFSVAGLRRKRVEELRLVAPALTMSDTHISGGGGPSPVGGGPAAPGWSIGRLVTHEAAVRLAPSDVRPGVVGTFSFDFHELGTDRERAARPHHVHLRDVRLRWAHHRTSLVVDDGSTEFTLADLLDRRRIARLRIDRGLLVLDRPLRERMGGGGAGAPTASRPWSVATLDLGRLGIRLSDLGPQIPDLTLFIRSRLTDVPLAPGGLAKATNPQRVELSQITLDSPVDPFRPVVHVGSVFIDFTIAELLQRRITSMIVVSPTIFLGEDLIWYMSATRAEQAAGPAEEPWTTSRLRVELGRLVLTFKGVDRAALPLNFRTDARNVVLGDLASLRLRAALQVPRQSYAFPGFDLDLIDVEGELRFDYPPGEQQDNVVNTLSVREIRWRDYRINDGWFSATFDEHGINGKLGGGAYAGYVNGGASLPFRAGPMAGWASCTDLDLAPLSAAAVGSYLAMTGVVDVEGAAEMLTGRLTDARATLDFTRPGQMTIPALDRLLERLPANALSWQRDLARIAVETFRDYPYDSGKGTLSFSGDRGEAHLGLDGERGKRQFDIYYHDETAPPLLRTAHEGQ
jgi:hypothetical protein